MQYTRLRHRFMLSASFAAHSIVVFDLDEKCGSNAALWDGFCGLFPDQIAAVCLLSDASAVDKTVKKRDAAVRKYERALQDYQVRTAASGRVWVRGSCGGNLSAGSPRPCFPAG